MTHQQILDALYMIQVDKLSTEAAKAEHLYRVAVVQLRDYKLDRIPVRKTKKIHNETWLEAQNEMALKVTEIISYYNCGALSFNYREHLDDRFYPVAYTVGAVLYENGVRA